MMRNKRVTPTIREKGGKEIKIQKDKGKGKEIISFMTFDG
jgi:hypothetical protein